MPAEKRIWIIGSRRSSLALVQAGLISFDLKKLYPQFEFEIKTITTTADKISDVALNKIGAQGVFSKEIEDALLKKEIDIAVHSMKDLPVKLAAGLELAAVTKRLKPNDCLISKQDFNLQSLPKGARVGTSSLRRRAQVLNIRPDLKILDLRGNIDTRVRKLEQGLYDAIVLAFAGIKRLGGSHCEAAKRPKQSQKLDCFVGLRPPRNDGGSGLAMTLIPIDELLPQAGQGALGIEVRQGDKEAQELVKPLDDSSSHLCIDAERLLLSYLGGGCHAPIGAYVKIQDRQMLFKAGVFSLDGKLAIRHQVRGNKKDFRLLAKETGKALFKQGAARILEGL